MPTFLFISVPFFSEALTLYLLAEEEQQVAESCKTTPLYRSLLKGVSPGGVLERTRAAQEIKH